MNRMKWQNLLCEERTRELLGGPRSQKAAKEGRTEFERDYGRTIYSAPFRRLKQKAQVFPLEKSDFVRTRLIHSQEVSSVAEDLASQVIRKISARGLNDEKRAAIPLIAATCGLIHDLGNPPFGHAGEQAISTWFEDKIENNPCFLQELNEQQRQDFLKFEGNAHTFRIVSHLWLLSDHYGLNYTSGTLAAARKYLAPSNKVGKGGHAHSKTGFFFSEREVLEKVISKTETLESRHPIAFLVEAADDLVYSVVDLEDGIKRKVLEWSDLSRYLNKECGESKPYQKAIARTKAQVNSRDFSGSAKGEAMAQVFRIHAISEIAIAAKEVFSRRYEAIMNGSYDKEILMDDTSEAKSLVDACKKFARNHLYSSPDILKLEVRGRRVIHDLMDLFWEAVKDIEERSLPVGTKKYPGKLYNLISDNYRRVFEKRLNDALEHPTYCKLQLVTDYVAGMTDPFACQLHRDLTNG
jgi:dGTPase